MARRLVALLVTLGLAAACGRDQDARSRRVIRSPDASATPVATGSPAAETASPVPPRSSARVVAPTRTPPPAEGPNLAAARVQVTRVAGFDQPLGMVAADGDLYVVEKRGRIRALRGGTVDPTPVLDISGEVSGGSEQGLLGMAISPDRSFVYVNFTDRSGDTHVREYEFRSGRAVTSTAREVLFVDQPFSNHNGGNLLFGPDGNLWIGLGDGGSANDPQNNAQNLNILLGKMLRIAPRPSGGNQYGIPPDNPFVGRQGARGEIWAFGLRNPWRYTFDRATGDLWIGDVGQNAWEEVDYQAAGSRGGENYGWRRMEGNHRANGDEPPDHVPPVFEYATSGGNCAVTGGYVYRGTRIPALRGAYLFGDYCLGRLRAFVREGHRASDERALGPVVEGLSSFGEDEAGEVYITSLQGALYRIDPE